MRLLGGLMIVPTSAAYISSRYATITDKFVKHYDVGCVKLVHHDQVIHQRMDKLLKWIKYPAGPFGTSTGVLALENNRSFTLSRQMDCSRTLHVAVAVTTANFNFTHLSLQMRLEKSSWLVFLNSSVNVYLRNSRLPFSLELFIVRFRNVSYADLYDVYRVDRHRPVRAIGIGNWSAAGGLHISYGTVYSRRKDLEGKVLRIGMIQNWPISYEITKSNGESEWDGLFPAVWRQISDVINITSQFVRSVDSTTGSLRSDGTWSGLIGMATRGEIDVIVSELTMDARRSNVLDFTIPLLKSKYQIYFKQPGFAMNWGGILKPFPRSLWDAILVWTCAASVVLWIVYRICVVYGIERSSEPPYGIITFLLNTVQALSQQGRSDTSVSAACRILFFSSYLVSAVVIPAYSASLISSLTQKTPTRPFNSIRDMLQNGRYKLLVAYNTAERDYFADTNNAILSAAYRRLILPVPMTHQMRTIRAGLATVCRENDYALFGIQKIIEQRMLQPPTPPCLIQSMARPLSTVHMGMALPKGHRLHPLINYHLTKMVEMGLLSRTTQAYWPPHLTADVEKWSQLRVEEVFLMFGFLCFAFAVALVIFIGEKLIVWQLKSRREVKPIFTVKHPYIN